MDAQEEAAFDSFKALVEKFGAKQVEVPVEETTADVWVVEHSEELVPNVVVLEVDPVRQLCKKVIRTIMRQGGFSEVEKLLALQKAQALLSEAILLQKEVVQ